MKKFLLCLLVPALPLLYCGSANAQNSYAGSIAGGGGGGGITIGAPITGTCPSGYNIYNNAGVIGCQTDAGSGTVTSVSVATANGVSGTVANPTTTPAITISLGAITPSSVAIGVGSTITSSGPGGALASGAYVSTGTSGGTVPLNNGGFTQSGAATFSSTLTFSGLSAGTQVSCLGLSSGNAVVTASCGGGSSTITAGTTATSGITSGDVIGSSSNLVVDTNIAYANIAVVNAANTFVSGQKIQASGATGGNASISFTDSTVTTSSQFITFTNDNSTAQTFIRQTNSAGAGTSLLNMPNSALIEAVVGPLYMGTTSSSQNVVIFAGGTVTATNTAMTINGTNQLVQFNKYTTAGIIVNDSSGNLTSSTSIKPGANSHYSYGGSAPALSACGTSPSIDANATDSSGTVTVGSVATGCVITFANAYSTFNHCRITSQSSISGLAYVYSKSAITISASVLGGDLVDYDCDGV